MRGKVQPEGFPEHGEQLVGRRQLPFLSPTIGLADGELAIEQTEPHASRRGTGGDEPVFEMRMGMRAGEPVGEFAVDGRHLLQREFADIAPLVAEANLMKQPRAFAHDPARFVRRGLLAVGVEPDRRGERETPDADIGEPGFTVELDAGKKMRARRSEIARTLPPHARAQRRDAKTEGFEHEQKEAVLLEAVAPAPVVDEFLKKRGGLERDAAAKENVEIFERDALHMGCDEGIERGERGFARTAVAGAGALEVALASHRRKISTNAGARGGPAEQIKNAKVSASYGPHGQPEVGEGEERAFDEQQFITEAQRGCGQRRSHAEPGQDAKTAAPKKGGGGADGASERRAFDQGRGEEQGKQPESGDGCADRDVLSEGESAMHRRKRGEVFPPIGRNRREAGEGEGGEMKSACEAHAENPESVGHGAKVADLAEAGKRAMAPWWQWG